MRYLRSIPRFIQVVAGAAFARMFGAAVYDQLWTWFN